MADGHDDAGLKIVMAKIGTTQKNQKIFIWYSLKHHVVQSVYCALFKHSVDATDCNWIVFLSIHMSLFSSVNKMCMSMCVFVRPCVD